MSHSDLAEFHAKHFGNLNYLAFFDTAIRHSVEQWQFAQHCTTAQHSQTSNDTQNLNDYQQEGEEDIEGRTVIALSSLH